MTSAELASAVLKHPYMLAHKLDGYDPRLCAVHGSLLFGDEECPFAGAVCSTPYPVITSELPVVALEQVLKTLENRDAEGKPNV